MARKKTQAETDPHEEIKQPEYAEGGVVTVDDLFLAGASDSDCSHGYPLQSYPMLDLVEELVQRGAVVFDSKASKTISIVTDGGVNVLKKGIIKVILIEGSGAR